MFIREGDREQVVAKQTPARSIGDPVIYGNSQDKKEKKKQNSANFDPRSRTAGGFSRYPADRLSDLELLLHSYLPLESESVFVIFGCLQAYYVDKG
jgi:hypothetical protein